MCEYYDGLRHKLFDNCRSILILRVHHLPRHPLERFGKPVGNLCHCVSHRMNPTPGGVTGNLVSGFFDLEN